MNAPPRSIRRSRLLPALLLFVAAATGCDIPLDVADVTVDDPTPTSLALAVGNTVSMNAGSTLNLGATVLDQYGAVMTDQLLTYGTSDSTTATVDANGIVTGVAAGDAAVTVTCGDISAVTLVTVRYHLLPGEARARIRGRDLDVEQAWDADAVFFDYVGSVDKDRMILSMQNFEYPDTGLILSLPAPLEAGSHDLPTASAEAFASASWISDLPAPAAYLVMELDDWAQTLLYVGTIGTRIVVDEQTAPTALGTHGRTRAHLRFVGVGYLLEDDGSYGPPTLRHRGDTVVAHVDVDVDYLHWGVGQASFTVEGGPRPTSGDGREAWWIESSWIAGGYGHVAVEDGPPYIDVSMPWPTVGTAPVDPHADPTSPGSARTISLWDGGSSARGLSGSITISEVDAPDPVVGSWGRIRGSTQAALGYWNSATQAFSDTATLTLQFDAVFVPQSAFAVASVAAEDPRPLWRQVATMARRPFRPGRLPGRGR